MMCHLFNYNPGKRHLVFAGMNTSTLAKKGQGVVGVAVEELDVVTTAVVHPPGVTTSTPESADSVATGWVVGGGS